MTVDVADHFQMSKNKPSLITRFYIGAGMTAT